MHDGCHGHSHGENVGDYFAEAGESSGDDDDDDSDEDGFPLGGRKKLRDDEVNLLFDELIRCLIELFN